MVIITGNFKDLSCRKFGKLTVLYDLHNNHTTHRYWLCVCDCGNLTEVMGSNLRKGHVKSCGCLVAETNKKHGKRDTKLYLVWKGIKNRCYNSNTKRYRDYGGRGIAVCSEWKDDFQAFYDWSMSNGYKEGLSIDRIDNDKGYSPDNCRFVNYKIQGRNKRNNKNYTINGETHCLSEWCEILGLNYKRTWKRINTFHWSIEKAFELEDK